MLGQRIITAILLLAVLLPILISNISWLFNGFILLVVVLGAWEWGRLIQFKGKNLYLYAGLIGIIQFILFQSQELKSVFNVLSCLSWITYIPLLMTRGVTKFNSVVNKSVAAMGIYLLPAAGSALIDLKSLGLPAILSVLILVWTADIGAYFSGKTFGKHKLAPNISPGKSLEGALGGGICVLGLSFLAYNNPQIGQNLVSILSQNLALPATILALLGLVGLSIQGDLFESLLKRQCGVKDSSQLLPGHGGILDRIDALLPVLPFAVLMINALI
jgi:phosphatidate cytidylyltransferase